MTELQAMTVINLRKLAKENKVKLSAGIDKEGIVSRIAEAMGLAQDEPATATASAAAEASVPAQPEAVKTEAAPEEAPARQEPQQIKVEELQSASLAADVTSVQPANMQQSWNRRPEEQDGYRPVYRQAWQARSAAQRETPQRPAWQQPARPSSTANRFGPHTAAPQAQPVQHEMREAPQAAQTPAYGGQAAPRIPENAPKLDGYRLGYRAAPQRPSYQSRDNGGYQQGNYRQNNNYNPGYRAGGYRAPAQNYGGYNQQGGYPQQSGGYNQQPAYPQRSTENHFSDGLYRVGRDPQFAEQAESGQTPDLLKTCEGENVSGVLEILPDGYGFLRSGSLLPGKKDIYVSVAQIRRYDLRTGDLVEGKARVQRDTDKFAALLLVERLNGQEAKENPERPNFDQLVAVYPNKRIALESAESGAGMVIRLVDLIAPIGFGQRAMIVTPPQSEGLGILRDISCAIKQNDKDAEVLMLLIDVAPEEVTEIRETANAEVFASTFADAPEMQTRVSETMLERAQRLVEDGRNVVILLDSLTKLTRAYQATLTQSGRPMNNTVTPAALVRPKRFFGAARNTREGGSLTVVATINVETGSRVDDIIFEEFKGTANMELFLLSPQQGDPIHPMIDLQRSGTKKDDMLLSEERKESLRSIRKVLGSTTNGEAVVQLIDMMKKTRCNEDLLSRLQDWVALWEKSGYLKR